MRNYERSADSSNEDRFLKFYEDSRRLDVGGCEDKCKKREKNEHGGERLM
jgi:hypothetical protein